MLQPNQDPVVSRPVPFAPTEDQRDRNGNGAPAPQPAAPETTTLDLKALGFNPKEAQSLGVIEDADARAESTYAAKHRTEASPVLRAVWKRELPIDLFHAPALEIEPSYAMKQAAFMEIVRDHCKNGTIYNEQGKVSDAVWNQLAAHGYWGQLNPKEHGGLGVSFRAFADSITKIATIDPNVAGLSSVHQCIGASGPLRVSSTPDQRERLMNPLSTGAVPSAFALTELKAGSDMSAVETTATETADGIVLNGGKRFITNAQYGGVIGVVAMYKDEHRIFIVELPKNDTPNFKLESSNIHALKHLHNCSLTFTDFPVQAENLLPGDGLKTAYQVLNLGRVALCANAAGAMRMMMAEVTPWAHHRVTYGKEIAGRELVQERMGEMAARIVGADAMSNWCASLLDQGYRGEAECIVAKIFGSNSQVRVFQLAQATYGGRAFKIGNRLGDNVHDFFAPTIYEGENEMLSLGLFKALMKDFGKRYFEPIAAKQQELDIKFNPLNPIHGWQMRNELLPITAWIAKEWTVGHKRPDLSSIDPELREHAKFACDKLQDMAWEIASFSLKYQMKAVHKQGRMRRLAEDVSDLTVLLVTCAHASDQSDPMVKRAADVLGDIITAKVGGKRETDRYISKVTRLGKDLLYKGNPLIEGLDTPDITMTY